jgi:hypothetical protein
MIPLIIKHPHPEHNNSGFLISLRVTQTVTLLRNTENL